MRSQKGPRLAHVAYHEEDDPDRPNNQVVGLLLYQWLWVAQEIGDPEQYEIAFNTCKLSLHMTHRRSDQTGVSPSESEWVERCTEAYNVEDLI